MLIQSLRDLGYEIRVKNHALAILEVDFARQCEELVGALRDFSIPVEELVGSGGGEALSTRRLRRRLGDLGWRKHNFVNKTVVDGRLQQSISHEIDHVRRGARGVIALEIEWNNKDPFFDRDLENFQRLHAQSVISLGVIVTRGASLQDGLPGLVRDCLVKHGVDSEAGLAAFDMKDRTSRQRGIVARRMEREGVPYPEAFAKAFVADKFGAATTHWAKLMARLDRGVGNPCPLIAVGIPITRVAV